LLDEGLASGAIQIELSVRLTAGGARVSVDCVNGDERLRVLDLEGVLGGFDRTVN
jgi:hypothetical protein